jgi:hypothetical protein
MECTKKDWDDNAQFKRVIQTMSKETEYFKEKKSLKVIDEFNIEEIDFTPPTLKTNKFRGKRTVIHL